MSGVALELRRSRDHLASVAKFAMVAPMSLHAYTDATAAGQALIAAQFATMLQVGVACHLAIPGRHLLGSLVARKSGGSSAPIISASPAYCWHSLCPQ